MSNTITRHNPPYNPFDVVKGLIDPTSSLNTARPLFTANEIANEDLMRYQTQGRTNACGTTGMAMVLQYWNGSKKTHDDIDREIRRLDTFSSPMDLKSYAEDEALIAEMYNNGSALELTRFIDAGVPVQLMVSADGSGRASKLHYVVVTAYEVEADGSLSFHLHDPNFSHDVKWDADELEDKWGNTPGGFDHFFLAYAPDNIDLPESRVDGLEGALVTVDGTASVIAGADRIIDGASEGERIRGVGDVAVGIPEALVGGAMGLGQQGTQWLEPRVRNVPVLGSPLGFALRQLEQQFGTVAQVTGVISESGSQVNSGLEHFLEGDYGAAMQDFGQASKTLFVGSFETVEEAMLDSLDAVEALPGVALDTARDVVELGANAFSALGSGVYDASTYLLWSMLHAGESLESVIDVMRDGASNTFGAIGDGVSEGAETLGEGASVVSGAVADGASIVGNTIAQGASDASNAIVDAADNALDKADDAVDDAVSFIGGLF